MLDAAITLVDREGAQALTMRRLAGEIGVEAMSLYNHVAGKQDILDGMAGLLIARMRPWGGIEATEWQTVLRTACTAYCDTITAHPHVFAASGGWPLAAGEDRAAFDSLMVLLHAAGFDDETASDVFQAAASYARGFAMSDIARAGAPDPTPSWDHDRAFSRGLTALIAGFDTMRAPRI